MGNFLELNGRGQLGLVRNLRRFVAFEVYGPLDFRGRIDIQFVGPDFRGAADEPADVRLATHGQNIALHVAVKAESPGKRGDASADSCIAVDVDVTAAGHHVSPDLALDGDISCIAANASIHLPGHTDLSRRGKHVSKNMARYFHVSARHQQVAFDGAGDANLPACDIEIAVNHFVFRNGYAVCVAQFRGRRLRRHHQRRAQSRKHQSQCRPAEDAPPQEHDAQPAQRRQCQKFQ